jgi:hypothetical protein
VRERERGQVVRVKDAVWRRWRGFEETRKASLTLLFSGGMPRHEMAAAVERACGQAIDCLEDAHPDRCSDGSGFRAGAWRVALATGGVALEIYEGPDDFEGLVSLIAEALERDGVDGTFDLLPSSVSERPVEVPLIECHLRIAGERIHIPRRAEWQADPDALWRVIHAGVQWCLANPDRIETSMSVSTVPRFAIDPADDLDELLRDAIDRIGYGWGFDFATAGGDRWRVVAVRPRRGDISLLEGHPYLLAPDRWPSVLGELRTFLVDNSSDLPYAFVRHGRYMLVASFGGSLEHDWPRRQGFHVVEEEGPYEDAYAPDAFALQLFGPGYVGRIPGGANWQHIPVDDGHCLLAHRDPRAWFETSFTPAQGDRRLADPPVPAVLRAARQDFSSLLFVNDLTG